MNHQILQRHMQHDYKLPNNFQTNDQLQLIKNCILLTLKNFQEIDTKHNTRH